MQQFIQRGEWEFLNMNHRPAKPRSVGLTEVRASYYTLLGLRYLQDLLESMAPYIDAIKFAGGAFTLIEPEALVAIIDTAHKYQVEVSTGGFMEYVLTQGTEAVRKYVNQCKSVGFDIIELSAGFITIPTDDWLRLIDLVQRAGLKAKPEVSIQFGAGGASSAQMLKSAGHRDTEYAIKQAKRFIEAGAYLIMVESEGITENTDPWRTDVPAMFIDELGIEKLMFEAADPEVFEWYIKNYGHHINLFVDHSQIVQLECLRSGIWGTQGSWGRIQGLK